MLVRIPSHAASRCVVSVASFTTLSGTVTTLPSAPVYDIVAARQGVASDLSVRSRPKLVVKVTASGVSLVKKGGTTRESVLAGARALSLSFSFFGLAFCALAQTGSRSSAPASALTAMPLTSGYRFMIIR